MDCKPVHQLLAQLKRGKIDGVISFRESLDGCRVAGFQPVNCTPCCFEFSPETPANEVADAIPLVWPAEYSSAIVNDALKACENPENHKPAFDDSTVAKVLSQAVSLDWCASGHTADSCHEIGLYKGDLARMKRNAEKVDYLVISCLPNDYSATSGSMVAALLATGVDVAALAKNKAADYRQTHSCWISQPIANQAYDRLVVFESTSAGAVSSMPGVFAAIRQFQPDPPASPNPGITLASSMLSTGSAGADPNSVLSTLFASAMDSINDGYNILGVRIVVFNQSWVAGLTTLFTQLKQKYNLQ